MSIQKLMSQKELDITIIASNNSIAPKILHVEKVNDEYLITMEKYPYTLSHANDKVKYRNMVKDKIYQLHKLGIFHADIHDDNIIVDEDKGVVKIIDYGLSEYITDIDDEFIRDYNAYHNDAQCIDELLQLEIDEVDRYIQVKQNCVGIILIKIYK